MSAALIFSLQFKPVQTYVAKKAAQYLSKELKTRIELKSIYIKPFKSVVLEGLLVEDQEKDTLLFTPRLTVDVTEFSLKGRKVAVSTAQLDNGTFYIKKYKDKSTNLDFIINYFDTGTTTPRTTPRRPYDVTFDKIVLNNIAFRYKNFQINKPVNGINFNDLHLRNLSTVVENLDTKNHLTKADFNNLTFREKSGFYLKNLTTTATIDTNRIEFTNLLLETPNSRISNYLLMEYKNFKDFGKFVNKVKMTAKFKNSRLYSNDIAFFAPNVKNVSFDIKLSGTATGYVDNFKALNMQVRAGKSTHFSGNFYVKGLPRIGNTYLDLNFKQLSTSRRDLDYILARLLKEKKPALPAVLDKFGNIHFAGHFKGYTNRFNTTGEFKTGLGRLVTNVNILLQNPSNPGYSGSLKAYDFNLGDLLNNKLLGRTTFATNIKGNGFKLDQLTENIKADVTYFDFKGYRYNNILVNGTFNKKLFKGSVKINDRNINLDFAGDINLNPALPVFNFTSTIKGANLHVLNLTKEMIQIDADIKTNFSGNDIDNLQGTLEIRQARLTNPENSFVIDSVTLTAAGLGNNRSLAINSDILDASITGQYHLKTLPSYFKSVVKSYIPSIDLKIAKYQPQSFDFKLRIKNFEPLSLLLMPELKIPEPAVLNGRFISSAGTATLNGFASIVQYKDIKVHNLILDESTTPEAMNIFLTSDRVDLTETIFIQNVNVANILRNDSLNLNIKLSDKDAINQLDLNALVEFDSKSFANLSLLPSDVIINRETWRITEQVKLGFDKGKVTVENFELFRDNQLLTIDGTFSNSPDDHLVMAFNHFKLTTFNPLTQGLGITLGGELNGDIQVAAIGKTPHIDGNIRIDSLKYNDVIIGDLTLKAGFDNSTKLVDVDAIILKSGIETLDINGTYNAGINERSLDLDMKLRENEIILFQPFLKNLVSNMTGTATADLKVTGKVTSPRIDGTLSLTNAGMTVNYLKTNYRITDDLTVNNTVIKLDDLILRDIKNNQATVNGTVDMRNPKIPNINITIVANQPFQALNTTAKDNPLYYGVAYGTGTFRFNGPTDDMKINILAKTEEGTIFNIPLNAAETVGKNDFITFVAKDSSFTKKPETSFKGLVMNFDLTVDEASEVNIITDLGRLSGRGDAVLNLNITSLGDFVMKGDYLISEGSFNFTAQDYINKVFDISQGGSIRWTGDPTQALINLKAVYGVRTSILPLYQAANRTLVDQQPVLAQAIINLTGSILRPDISFDLNFPSDTYVKDELQSYLSDVNNLNQQALSLIVRRTFATGSGNLDIGDQATSTVLSAGYELAFNHLNNILAQSLNLKTVDFNIRSFNDASASIRFLNDRLILTGGVTDRRSNIQQYQLLGSSIARDVEAQYLVKKDGTLILRASNRLNNRNFLNLNANNDEYVSAIGLVYRQDFDNLNEFLQLLIGKKRREDRGVPPPVQAPKPPINVPTNVPATVSKKPD